MILFKKSKSLVLVSIITVLFAVPAFAASISTHEAPTPEAEDIFPNWSQILSESGVTPFMDGLDQVVECLQEESEELTPASLPAEKTYCQKRAEHFVSHRNSMGDSLLKQFMLRSDTRDYQVTKTLKMLERVGVDIYGMKSTSGDSVFFYAIEKQNLFFVKYLLDLSVEDHPEIKALLPEMKSADGISLANLLLKQFPHTAGTASTITKHHLAPDLSELDQSNSIAYLTLKYSRVEL